MTNIHNLYIVCFYFISYLSKSRWSKLPSSAICLFLFLFLYRVFLLICIYSEIAQNKAHSFLLGGLNFLGDIMEKHTFTEE